MLQYERFDKIIQRLGETGVVKVADLAAAFGVSESTVRRDIAVLDRAGRLKKVFGGAVMDDDLRKDFLQKQPPASRLNMQDKAHAFADEKRHIAKRAAALIEDGDFVFLDAGTTVGAMIEYLDNANATYVTNGPRHALALAAKGLPTYVLAGSMKTRTEAIVGQGAVDSLQRYHFTKCFMGATALDEKHGYTTYDIEESMVKKAAMACSIKCYVLLDGSKFEKTAPVSFAKVADAIIITDKKPARPYKEAQDILLAPSSAER